MIFSHIVKLFFINIHKCKTYNQLAGWVGALLRNEFVDKLEKFNIEFNIEDSLFKKIK